jgi:hypothetical protein
MKLKEISRTATFAWSPTTALPLLATGAVAGALDESFSNESQLEVWAPDFNDAAEYDLGGEARPGPRGVVHTTAKRVHSSVAGAGADRGTYAGSIVLRGGMSMETDPRALLLPAWRTAS